jgi:hypothetical protein
MAHQECGVCGALKNTNNGTYLVSGSQGRHTVTIGPDAMFEKVCRYAKIPGGCLNYGLQFNAQQLIPTEATPEPTSLAEQAQTLLHKLPTEGSNQELYNVIQEFLTDIRGL